MFLTSHDVGLKKLGNIPKHIKDILIETAEANLLQKTLIKDYKILIHIRFLSAWPFFHEVQKSQKHSAANSASFLCPWSQIKSTDFGHCCALIIVTLHCSWYLLFSNEIFAMEIKIMYFMYVYFLFFPFSVLNVLPGSELDNILQCNLLVNVIFIKIFQSNFSHNGFE